MKHLILLIVFLSGCNYDFRDEDHLPSPVKIKAHYDNLENINRFIVEKNDDYYWEGDIAWVSTKITQRNTQKKYTK